MAVPRCELLGRLVESPPDLQKQLHHDLKILIAALIQIERTIQVHRPTVSDRRELVYASSGHKLLKPSEHDLPKGQPLETQRQLA